MKLVDVRKHPRASHVLYSLLEERKPYQSISHRAMPTLTQHACFVSNYGPKGDPYAYWALIDVDGKIVGATYLTRRDEIGIGIFENQQRRGYGKAAVRLLMQLFGPREYLANINPNNLASIELFRSLGFNLCQVTMRREVFDAD